MLHEKNILSFIDSHRTHAMGACNFFYKSLDGRYLCSDERTAFIAGVENSQKMVHKRDHELRWSAYREQYKTNDKLAMQLDQSIIRVEDGINIHSQPAKLLSLKKRVIGLNGKLSGVFAMICLIEEIPCWELPKILEYISNSLDIITENPKYPRESQTTSLATHSDLTRREKDCAHYLCLGMNAREIGIHLNLSKRTIESYIANMKDKLMVKSKSELIMKLLDNNRLQLIKKI